MPCENHDWVLTQLGLADNNMPVMAVLMGFALFAMVMLLIMYLISNALRTLRAGAERFASGDLSQPIDAHGPLQVAALGESLNQMARQLDQRMQTVVEQRNALQTVFASMTDGVIGFDLEEHILHFNQAAEKLLNTSMREMVGRSIQEVIRNPGLSQLIGQVLTSDQPRQAQLHLLTPPRTPDETYQDRYVQVQGTALRDASGRRIGGLIVLHDMTKIKRLELIRRDFVANVSHELKTPISTIKAAAETLNDIIKPEAEPDSQNNSPDFLRIIVRQADRLHAIIEDLLALARLEQDEDQPRIPRSPHLIAPVLQGAWETCSAKAQNKRIQIQIDCPKNLKASINAPLIEQALVNLLDNAIKYSHDQGQIILAAYQRDQQLVLQVQDQGQGIAPEHLPRLFERFYRIDKARSREQGGTGLGLAITKHVAQVHDGQVYVESAVQQGSTFTLVLPMQLAMNR